MSDFLFLEYPKCSTCQKARRWLENNNMPFTSRHIVENCPSAGELRLWIARSSRHIVENCPSAGELRLWIARSGRPATKFFNTSGLKYKALNLKERLPQLTEEEQIALLASDGMLIKRPLLIGENIVLSGFRLAEWESLKI